MTWWLWLLGAMLSGLVSAMFAMLSLSAGTAYGTDYHSLSPAQRVMARVLYLGALIAALACGLAAVTLAAWAMRLLFA